MRIGRAIWALVVPSVLLAMPAGLWGAEGDPPQETEKPAAPFEAAEVLRYMPDDCRTFGWIDVDKLRGTETGKILLGGEKCLGVKQPGRIILGSTGGPVAVNGGVQVCNGIFIAVVDLGKPATSAEVAELLSGQYSGPWHEETVGNTTLHVQTAEKPVAFLMPTDRSVVLGTYQLLSAALLRDGPAQLPEPLSQACQRLDRSQAICLAIAPLEILQAPEAVQFLPDDMRRGIAAVLFEANLDLELRFRLSVVCTEAPVAQQLQGIVSIGTKASQAMGLQATQSPEIAGFLTSLNCSVNDQCLVVQGAVPPSLLKPADTVPAATSWTPVAMNPGNAGTGAVASSFAPGPIRYSFGASAAPSASSYPSGATSNYPYSSATSFSAAPTSKAAGLEVSPAYGTPVAPSVPNPGTSYAAPTYPMTPYPPYSVGSSGFTKPYASGGYSTPYTSAPSGRIQQADTKQEIEILTGRCAELQQRLEQVEQDRDLLAERVALYLKQLEAYRQQLGTQPKQGSYSGSLTR